MGRSRAFCFTINNYTEERERLVRDFFTSNAKYGIYGREVGSNGTRHLQGYVYFANSRSFESVARALGEPRAHIEHSKGTPSQNKTYCSKSGDIYEHGELPSQGRRKDLEKIRESIEDGADELSIAKENFSTWCQYRRSFVRYRQLLQADPRTWKTMVVWIYGPTGTGKTRFVHERYSTSIMRQLNYCSERYNGNAMDELSGLYTAVDASFSWADGYSGQDRVLIDDYRGECPLPTLLRVCDRYPMQLPCKGGFINWRPRVIYITSNWLPRDCYKSYASADLEPLFRRIDFLLEKPSKTLDFVDRSSLIRFS